MIRFGLILLLLLSFPPAARAAAGQRLDGIATTENPGHSRIVLNFTAIPAYRLENSGQRVDLILPGASVSGSWRGQAEGARVIKVQLAQRKNELVVSFLLRQPPARILTSVEGSRLLVLDLFWQQPPARTAIAFQVPGLPTAQNGVASSTVKPASRYSGNWERFFREFRTPLVIPVSARYSAPALPTGQADPQAIRYLESLALAMAGDPYGARVALLEQRASLDERHPLLPYVRLLQAEIALSIGTFGEVAGLLEKAGKSWPAALEPRRQACLAAALAKAGSTDQAITAYRALGEPLRVLAGQPLLLENAASLFFTKGEYATAAGLYRALAEEIAEPAPNALARFAAALATYQGGAHGLAVEEMKQLTAKFTFQEAGQRAWLKLLDHGVLSGREAEYPVALSGYGNLAQNATLKSLREEAAFKQALILAWSDEPGRSVNVLQGMLRDFRGGALRGEAEALLMELLPPLIQAMVKRGEDLQAVVLVEQHRQLLMSGGLGWSFLLELASAFRRLELPERASRIYLYMLDGPRPVADKEPLYLPLVQLFSARGEYEQAAVYAAQYFERYPQGKDRSAVFLGRLQALRQAGRQPEAVALLRAAKIPWDREVELETARILTAAGDYRLLAELVGQPQRTWEPTAETLLLQAEALRTVGQEGRALPLFRRLMEEETFADQAAFRYAQIRLEQGERAEALKILGRLVETSKSQLWRRLAEDTLRASAS